MPMDEDLGEEEDGYKKAKNRKRQRSAGGGGAGGYLLDDFASIGAGGGGGGGAVVGGGDDTGAQGSLLLCLPSCLPSRLVAGIMHKQQQLIAWLFATLLFQMCSVCLPALPLAALQSLWVRRCRGRRRPPGSTSRTCTCSASGGASGTSEPSRPLLPACPLQMVPHAGLQA